MLKCGYFLKFLLNKEDFLRLLADLIVDGVVCEDARNFGREAAVVVVIKLFAACHAICLLLVPRGRVYHLRFKLSLKVLPGPNRLVVS
jgi:hypothetical protein